MPEDSNIARVAEFHRAFGLTIRDAPGWPSDDFEMVGRIAALGEETNELLRAVLAHDLIAVFDAVIDLRYVLDSTILSFGFKKHFEAGCAEVHESNMTKLDRSGKPFVDASGKIGKGPNYRPPDLKHVLESALDREAQARSRRSCCDEP